MNPIVNIMYRSDSPCQDRGYLFGMEEEYTVDRKKGDIKDRWL